MKLRLFAGVAGIVTIASVASAQTDRIPIRVAPAPNQTVHGTMTMDLSLDVTIDGAPANAPAPPGPITLGMNMTMSHSLAVGSRDDTGGVTAHITLDDATATTTMNGMPMPMPMPAASLKGLEAAVVFDASGTVTDVTANDPKVPAAMKQIVSTVLQSLPVGTLAVGESATVPLALNIPLPMSAAGANATGTTTVTLKSISVENGQRVAHYTSDSSGRFDAGGAMPVGGGATSGGDAQFTMTGTTDVNIDRGITQSADMHGTLEADFHANGGAITVHIAGPIRLQQRTTF